MQPVAKRRLPPETLVALILSVLVFPMWIPTFQKVAGNNRGLLRDLGFQSGPSGTALAWMLALLVAAAFIAFAVRNIPAVARTWRQVSWLKGFVFVAAIAAATVEEAFFRRWVMDTVLQAGGGAGLQVIVSAIVFGLPHGLFGLFKRSPGAAARAALATGIMGGVLAIVYVVGGRSLAPCIAAHFLITFTMEPGLLLAAVTGRWRFDRAGAHR